MLSILPFERVTREPQRDTERPFKAYPRPPVSLPSSSNSYYGPFAPPSFIGSVGIPASHTTPHPKRTSELAMDLRGAPHSGHLMYDHNSGHHHHHPQHLMDISHATRNQNLGLIKSEDPLAYSSSLSPTHGYPPSGGADPAGMPQSASTMGPNGLTSTVTSTTHSQMEDANSSSTSEGSPCNGQKKGIPLKKRALAVPEDLKDQGYWDKRKKNNESAKRSREARRMKEEQIAMRVVYLEQENLQLRTEVSLLKSEIEKLRCMLYNS